MQQRITRYIMGMFCALLLSSTAQAKDGPALTVDVSIEPRTVELGQTFQYTINAATQNNQSIRMIKEPDFRPFSILGRSQMPQFIIRNGVSYHRTTLVYHLKTRRLGEFLIDPPVLAVGKHKALGKKVKIKVVEKGKAPKSKTIRTRNASAFVDIKRDPEQRNPYVGEQITLDYALFVDSRRMNAQPQPPTEPSLNAFWIEDLSSQISGTKQVIRQGSRFLERIGLRRYALFPLKAGATTIEPMKINLVTGGFFQRQQTVTVESDPVKLKVKPLPPGAPKGFDSSNVGQWSFLVTTDNLHGQIGRPITIKVTVSGSGQASRLVLPKIPKSEDYRIINSEEDVKRKIKDTTIKGTKTATYAILPLKEGTLTIPTLSFVYFDPNTAQYQTNQSPPITIQIKGGQLPPEPEKRAAPIARKQSTGKDLLSSLRSELREPFRGFTPSTNSTPFAKTWMYKVAVAIPLFGLLFLFVGPQLQRRLRRETPQKRRKQALKEAQALLATTQQAPQAYDHIVEAIKRYLTQAMALPSGAVTGRELAGKLKKCGVDEPLAEQLANILQTCNDARYGGQSNDTSVADLLKETETHLIELDKQLGQNQIKPWPTLIVLLCVGLLLPSTLSAQTATIQSAIDAQDAQQWDKAVEQWQALKKDHPRDPYILYNLGTAALHKGDLANARLALELAMLYKPNAPRITKNLEVAAQMVHLKTLEQVRGRAQRLGAADPFWSWNIARRLTPTLLSWSLLIGLWLLFVLTIAYRRMAKDDGRRDMIKMVWGFAFVVAITAALSWGWRTHMMQTVKPAIVMNADAPLKEGPSELAAPRKGQQPLVPGTKIAVEETRKQWIKVRLPDQSTGWLPKDSLTLIQ